MNELCLGISAVLAVFAILYSELKYLQKNAYRPQNPFERLEILLREGAIIAVLGGLSCVFFAVNMTAGVALFGMSALSGFIYAVCMYTKERTPLRLTKRAIRLASLEITVFAALITVAVLFINSNIYKVFVVLLIVLCSRLIADIIAFAIYPFERINNLRYIKIAKKKIASIKGIKIAITGSAGKTSCKNILTALLNEKYKVLTTSGNYNTPMGIALTSKKIKGGEEVFIAEMGARKCGEIKELCDIVKPSIAIITGVGGQHLGTFKTVDNIYRTKKELVDSLPADGFAVYNGDNELSSKMSRESTTEAIVVTTGENGGVKARDIKMTNAGSSFTVYGLWGSAVQFTTRLLGRHNIINIMLAAAVAEKLGIRAEDAVSAVAKLKPVPHRLELMESSGAVTVIDDSYNCNAEGARFALEVLSMFEGRKIVFSQGIIEGGGAQYEINESLGALIGAAANIVMLTGENVTAIRSGLAKSGFSDDNVRVFENFYKAQAALPEIVRPGDVILFQNDLP